MLALLVQKNANTDAEGGRPNSTGPSAGEAAIERRRRPTHGRVLRIKSRVFAPEGARGRPPAAMSATLC